MALLHVFGDSHAHYLFSRAPGAIVNWLGPYTMHRIGRDGVDFLGRRVNDGDKVLFVFGEIDVRCHMVRVDRERGNGIESVATDLASRYTAAVMQASVGLPRSTFERVAGSNPAGIANQFLTYRAASKAIAKR